MEYNAILSFDKTTAGIEGQTAAVMGLEKAVSGLHAAMTAAFCDAADGMAGAKKAASSLSAQLFLLRMYFGKLKAAISRAAAPIALVFLPAINRGILAATRFVKTAGAVIAALLGGVSGTDALAGSAQAAADAEVTLAKTSTAAGKAVKGALAGFDELEILSFSGGSGSTTTAAEAVTLPALRDTITPAAQAIADKILALLAPLRAIDFAPAEAAFARLGEAIRTFGALVAQGLEWAWFHLLAPLAKWVIEKAVPASVDVLTAAFSALTAIFGPVQGGLQSLLTALQPVFGFLAGAAVTALEQVKTLFEKLAQTFTDRGTAIRDALAAIGEAMAALWTRLEPILNNWMVVFSAAFTYISDAAVTWAGLLMDIFSGLAQFLAGAFTGDWSRAWEGITAVFSGAGQAITAQMESLKAFLAAALPAMAQNAALGLNALAAGIQSVFGALPGTVKTTVNGVIGLVNSMVAAVVSGINAVIRGLNQVRFHIPDWVPGLGGQSFGLSLGYVSAPQIPYLAQGAVLPANKPFLAVVGDQKNGTNVEAPLATIQQAVAAVLSDSQEAQIALLRQILQAVLGIEVGDTVIGQAAERYRRKMAVVTGGML